MALRKFGQEIIQGLAQERVHETPVETFEEQLRLNLRAAYLDGRSTGERAALAAATSEAAGRDGAGVVVATATRNRPGAASRSSSFVSTPSSSSRRSACRLQNDGGRTRNRARCCWKTGNYGWRAATQPFCALPPSK